MKYLYKFYWDCGRGGYIDGLFLADPDQVNKVIGKTIHFGEALGKHSDVYGTLEEDDLVLISEDPLLVSAIEHNFESDTLSGYNPIIRWEDTHEDYEDDDE